MEVFKGSFNMDSEGSSTNYTGTIIDHIVYDQSVIKDIDLMLSPSDPIHKGVWIDVAEDIRITYAQREKHWWQPKKPGYMWELAVDPETSHFVEIHLFDAEHQTKQVIWRSKKADRDYRENSPWNGDYDPADYSNVGSVMEDVRPADIVGYPTMMGKGSGGCVQLRRYAERGLYDEYRPKMSELSMREVLEHSATDEAAIQECIKSDRCGFLHARYLEGTLGDIGDKIHLSKVEGKYYYGRNGSHRCCLMKRIQAEKVQASVTEWKRNV